MALEYTGPSGSVRVRDLLEYILMYENGHSHLRCLRFAWRADTFAIASVLVKEIERNGLLKPP